MKERMWLISEVFYPDTDIATGNIATEIAVRFSQQYEVHVICGPADYDGKKNRVEKDGLNGQVILHRVTHFNFDKNHPVKRLFRVAGISSGLFLKGFGIRKGEKVFVVSNPAFIIPLYSFLRVFKRFKYIVLMHDVFPENLVTGGYIRKWSLVYKITRKVFELCRKVPDQIIVIGRDMKDLLLETFPLSRAGDITIIPNWADVETVRPDPLLFNEAVKQYGLEGKLIILFAGNHGVLQNLKDFLEVLKKVNNPSLHFVFAGGGSEKPVLEAFAKEMDLSNTTFLPAFPRKELNRMQNSCHIGLVSLKDSFYGVGVPSKSYNILGAGKPILFIGNKETEIAQFVEESDTGWAFNYSGSQEIINFLNSLSFASVPMITEKGNRGRQIVEDSYSKEKVLEAIMTLVTHS